LAISPPQNQEYFIEIMQVANLGGEFEVGLQAHTQFGNTKTFGHLKGDRKSSPEKFLKKQTGTMGNETLP